MSEAITVEYLMAEPLNDFDVEDKSEFVVGFIEEFEEEFKEEYGDEAEKRLNQEALEEYETLRQMRFTKMAKESRDYILTEHEEELRKSLFNRFRRFDIDHRQFPDKYRALFNETRDEFCANYRIPQPQCPGKRRPRIRNPLRIPETSHLSTEEFNGGYEPRKLGASNPQDHYYVQCPQPKARSRGCYAARRKSIETTTRSVNRQLTVL